jgi:rhodanese-related sulfurtransferase
MIAGAGAFKVKVGGRRLEVGARRLLLGLGLVLGVGAAFAGSPTQGPDVSALAGEIEREEDHVTATELAEWVRDRKPGLRVIDVRSDSEYAAYHVPSAEHVPLPAIGALAPRGGETLVLYSGGGAHAAQAWVLLRASGHERVYFLRGGLLEWMDNVMSPALDGADPAADARVAALSRYFGGVPHAAGTTPASVAHDGPTAATAATPHDVRAAVAALGRRGC